MSLCVRVCVLNRLCLCVYELFECIWVCVCVYVCSLLYRSNMLSIYLESFAEDAEQKKNKIFTVSFALEKFLLLNYLLLLLYC